MISSNEGRVGRHSILENTVFRGYPIIPRSILQERQPGVKAELHQHREERERGRVYYTFPATQADAGAAKTSLGKS